MRPLIIPVILLSLTGLCQAQQTRPNLYVCEGCEAIYEHSFENLSWETTIPDDTEPGEPTIISGIVYQTDGSTPAEGVILYVYHTNAEGVYPKRGDEKKWARRHGYLRGWMKTDADGRYRFTTIRPATYPSNTEPAHIHIILKERKRQEYWIDAYHFEGDPLLTEEQTFNRQQRGDSGIIPLVLNEKGVWIGVRNIVLEY